MKGGIYLTIYYMDLNRATILGRMVRDPESRTTPNGQQVVNMTIATGRSWTDAQGVKQQRTEFHNCVVWGKLAEIAAQYLNKGRRVYAEGRIETRSWDATDGTKKYRTELIIDNFIMLDGPRESSNGGSDNAESTLKAPPAAPPSSDDEIKVEDIPF